MPLTSVLAQGAVFVTMLLRAVKVDSLPTGTVLQDDVSAQSAALGGDVHNLFYSQVSNGTIKESSICKTVSPAYVTLHLHSHGACSCLNLAYLYDLLCELSVRTSLCMAYSSVAASTTSSPVPMTKSVSLSCDWYCLWERTATYSNMPQNLSTLP